MKTIVTVSPITEEILAEYRIHSRAEVKVRLEEVNQAQLSWRKTSPPERAQVLLRIAKILRAKSSVYAQCIHAEMGKTLIEAQAEIEKCAGCAEYYAENLERFLQAIPVQTSAKQAVIAFEPLGNVYAIMPWNFPFWQAFRAAIPAIAAGNGVILKHASNVTGSSLAIEEIWHEALHGLPLLRTLILPGHEALEWIGHSAISAVTFTGSTPVGKRIAQEAGQSVKKCVLELGGSDPFLVLADADLSLAAQLAAKSRLLNSGQSCISAKRFIVDQSVTQEFLQKFHEELLKTELAPLARRDLRDELHQQVSHGLQEGAQLHCGGEIPQGKGFYYPATLLSGVTEKMSIFREETFGPVAVVIAAADTQDAIRLANATSFGLGAALFTRDEAQGLKILRQEIAAGNCFLNDFVRSDSRLPFGGIKESGYGRELSEFGFREFINIKTIVAG
jgi:succinate-semialdehyde dehydrogenase/glutarate-semialdehyde dehydrogenase